ncbi:lipase 3-like isoform X3 [Adelges cooleyi]|uniref:lipase 3-like isoform X3 n=1 Tax=Adelges cooleyi TaxID=133065 RepID=UPI00217FC44B|nr:lipase 3-like isoform X3 [Adelges cooleyi]
MRCHQNHYSRTRFLSIFITVLSVNLAAVFSLDTVNQVREHGYPLKTYKFWTPDKYLLGLERIPYSKDGNGTIGRPVLLLHGLFLSSVIFTLNSSSLSFVLSDAGFDVWLFNARGLGLSRALNIYARDGAPPRMNKISWDFSWHEMGVLDMTTAIDFVLNETGYSKIDILGYSLGTTMALAGLSNRPKYNDKINKLVLMAPTSRLKELGMPLSMVRRYARLITVFLNRVNFLRFSKDPDTKYRMISNICSVKYVFEICKWFIDLAQGVSTPLSNDSVVSILSVFPQPVSSRTLKHYIQLMISRRFCHYDFGPAANMRLYGTVKPPDYNLFKVTAPTYVIHSKDDTIASPMDVKWLVNNLPNVKYVYYIDNVLFGHLSFSLSPDMKELVNLPTAHFLLDDTHENSVRKRKVSS